MQEQVAPQLQLELPQCSIIVAFVAGMKQRNSKIERERERERDGDDDDKSSSKTRKLAILTNSRTCWFSATASLLVIYKMGLLSQKEIPFFFFGELWGPLKIYIYKINK